MSAYSNSDEFSEDEERFFTDDRDTMLTKIFDTLGDIDNLLKNGYDPNRSFDRDEVRKQND